MLLKSVTVSAIISLAAAQSCAPLYYQCGGENWNGTTCCEAGSYCKAQNSYYHQCVADEATADISGNNTIAVSQTIGLNTTAVAVQTSVAAQTSVVENNNWNSTLAVPHIPSVKDHKHKHTVFVTKSAPGKGTVTFKKPVKSTPPTHRHKHHHSAHKQHHSAHFNTSLVESVIAPSSIYESSVNASTPIYSTAEQSSVVESVSSEADASTVPSSTSEQIQFSTFVSEETPVSTSSFVDATSVIAVPVSSAESVSSAAVSIFSAEPVSSAADSIAAAPSSSSVAPAPVASKSPVNSADNELTFTPIAGGKSGTGKTTRYWDCCKPSCSWSGKADVSSPVAACKADGKTISDVNDQSGCNGGDSYMCSNQQPFALNSTLAFGFVAASMVGYGESNMCCTCVLLTFNDGPVAGKQMVAQVTNTGSDLSSNHFDIAMPGGGFGIFSQGCPNQWNSPASNWGQTYGGVSSASECSNLPSELQTGCDWRWDFLENADNPSVSFVEIECPSQITDITGCKRN
ncbi:hypothetical protein DS838_001875 [Geotrichum bryndzae]|nr:hypothetical protein DUD61_003575 [Geotrichum candidum]KAI9213231.1 hypothetical protein DS838_001875 [Geotrichum bryndzae]